MKNNNKKILFSVYVMSNRFLNTVIEKQGKDDLSFRDCYNYRNLEKDEDIYNKFDSCCPLPSKYECFPKETIDYYISEIGKDKFKKCLDDKGMNIKSLFDDQDIFIDCKDVLDYYHNRKNNKCITEGNFHRYDFEHYLMEELDDDYGDSYDQPLEKGRIFYVFRPFEYLEK